MTLFDLHNPETGVCAVKKNWKPICIGICLILVAAAGIFLFPRPNTTSAPQSTVAETEMPVQTVPEVSPETEPELPAPTVAETEPVPVTYDTVPLFFQTDYPYIKFGDGTIATSGCSMAALAMVATYMTDHEYTPDQLAYHFENGGKDHVERLEYAAQQLGLPYEKNFNWHETQQALREGKVAIVMENGKSYFTTGGHFLVLSGLTEDDRIIVKDPYEPNYSSELLTDGFFRGFHEFDITRGYSGAWVFDKSEMPDDFVPYDASKPELPDTRYTGYELPEEDRETLARLAWVQARNQPQEVQQAVVEVILNRLTSDAYPNTITRVLWWSETFGSVRSLQSAEPEQTQYDAVDAAMYGPYILPKDVLYYSPWWIDGDVWGQVGSYWFAWQEP